MQANPFPYRKNHTQMLTLFHYIFRIHGTKKAYKPSGITKVKYSIKSLQCLPAIKLFSAETNYFLRRDKYASPR